MKPISFNWQNGGGYGNANEGLAVSEDHTGPLSRSQTLAVAQPVTYDLYQVTAPVNRQNRAPGDPCHTLARDNAAHAAIVQQPVAYGVSEQPSVAHCLRSGASKADKHESTTYVAQPVATDLYNGEITGDVAATLGTPGSSVNASGPTVMTAMQVRRLTPVECERLQGFPDGYTAIPWRNKPASECPDGPRYKALGNSMAVPVMRWIGQQLDKVK